jgi:hypothetical protein
VTEAPGKQISAGILEGISCQCYSEVIVWQQLLWPEIVSAVVVVASVRAAWMAAAAMIALSVSITSLSMDTYGIRSRRCSDTCSDSAYDDDGSESISTESTNTGIVLCTGNARSS